MTRIFLVTNKRPRRRQVVLSYWTTLGKAQGALRRYIRAGLVGGTDSHDRPEILTVTLDIDAFTPRRAHARKQR